MIIDVRPYHGGYVVIVNGVIVFSHVDKRVALEEAARLMVGS